MTVGELARVLEDYDDETEVVIGMIQTYGSNFAMNICDEIEELNVNGFYGGNFNALVLTEGSQIGTVSYED